MPGKQRKAVIIGAVLAVLGIAGLVYALLTIAAAERVYQENDREFRVTRDELRETDPEAAEALPRPVREYAGQPSAAAVITIIVLIISAAVFFTGVGFLLARAANARAFAQVKQSRVTMLTFSALCIALTLVLSEIRVYSMPMGGSVTAFGMLPIVLAGYWFGARAGFTVGFVCGILQLILGAVVVHPIQFILDYPLAFAALGCFCVFRKKRFGLQISFILGAIGRFICSFISGVVYFGEYAPVGQSSFVYSALYQLTYLTPEVIVTLVVISLPTVAKAIDHLRPAPGHAAAAP